MANELRLFQNYLGGRLLYALPAAASVLTDGVTTNGDATLDSATGSFTAADVGAPLAGSGIPAGAYVLSINSATSVEMSANATATASGVSVTISREKVIHSTALAAMSTIDTTNHQMVGLDPDGLAGAPEVVKVTKHNAAAQWAQITRAQETTVARAHAAGMDWIHGPFASDVGYAETAWLPASAMTALGGSAALTDAGGSSQRTPVFGLDPASAEICGGSLAVPLYWSTFDVDVFWMPVGTGGGVCRFRIDYQTLIDGATANSRSFGSQVEPAGPAQYVVEVTRVASDMAVPASGVLRIQVERDAGHANDTMSGDMGVIGILLTRSG